MTSDASDPSSGCGQATFFGRVVPGKGQAGPVLDFPTLNLEPDRPVELDHGMHGAVVESQGHQAEAVLYVGTRPTFEDGGAVSYEVHLIDPGPEQDPLLEVETLAVEVRFLVREERSFPTVQALRDQQFRDREEIRRRLG